MRRPTRSSLAAEAAALLRANLASLAATGVDWAVVTAAVHLGGHYLAAAAAGSAAGAVTDFALKRHWAFARPERRALATEALRYLAVSASSLAWNLLVAWVAVGGLGAPPLPGVIGASLLVGLAWNYPLHRRWVFGALAR